MPGACLPTHSPATRIGVTYPCGRSDGPSVKIFAGDDHGSAFQAAVDELEEHVGFGAVEGEVADFVDDEESGAEEGLELSVEPAGGFWPCVVDNQVVQDGEVDGHPALVCSVGEADGHGDQPSSPNSRSAGRGSYTGSRQSQSGE